MDVWQWKTHKSDMENMYKLYVYLSSPSFKGWRISWLARMHHTSSKVLQALSVTCVQSNELVKTWHRIEKNTSLEKDHRASTFLIVLCLWCCPAMFISSVLTSRFGWIKLLLQCRNESKYWQNPVIALNCEAWQHILSFCASTRCILDGQFRHKACCDKCFPWEVETEIGIHWFIHYFIRLLRIPFTEPGPACAEQKAGIQPSKSTLLSAFIIDRSQWLSSKNLVIWTIFSVKTTFCFEF